MSEANGFVTRDAFLQPKQRRFHVVDVPGMGKIRIRSINELERSRYEATALDKKGNISSSKLVDMKCRLIVLAVVDGDGNQLFSNSDIGELQKLDSKITNTIVEAIRSHCGISDEDFDELEKKTETSGGNSP